MTRRFTYNTATLSPNYSRRTQVQYPGGEWVSYSYGLSYEPNGWISWMVSSNGNTNLPDPGVNNVNQAPRGGEGRGGGRASVGYDPTSTWIISRDAFAGCWFLG